MTDVLVLDGESARTPRDDDPTAVRRLVDELLAIHDEAGACVAALVDENSELWQAAHPWVVRLVAEARQTMHHLACLGGRAAPDGASPVTTIGPVPPVVWARELGVVQRGMWRAVRRLEGAATAGQQVAVLRDAVGRTRWVASALRAAALT